MSGQRAWRDGVHAVIRAQAPLQGSLGIDRMCALAGVSRAGYYRAWRASAPRQEATELRHQIQLLRRSRIAITATGGSLSCCNAPAGRRTGSGCRG